MRYYSFALIFLGFAFISTAGSAQEVLNIDQTNSKVWVDGTSTLKNWSAQVQSFEGQITLDGEGQISSVELSFDATTMDGGRGPDMNNKIYKALKTDQHPNIKFSGVAAAETPSDVIASQGTITIAGKSREAIIKADGSYGAGIKGSYALKLSDFEIEPPTAMFGQIVCHDDITLGFELSFK